MKIKLQLSGCELLSIRCVKDALKKCCLSLAQFKQSMANDVCALRVLLTAQQTIISRFSGNASQTRLHAVLTLQHNPQKPKQVDSQAPAQNKEADVASLHLGGLRLSARLTISFGDDSGLARPVLPANPSRYTVCHALLYLPTIENQ